MRKTVTVSVPELAFVAGTRGLAGAGIGLPASRYLSPASRRSVGLTLLTIGALTTLPIAAAVLHRTRKPPLLAD
jgi:hypothetical protein